MGREHRWVRIDGSEGDLPWRLKDDLSLRDLFASERRHLKSPSEEPTDTDGAKARLRSELAAVSESYWIEAVGRAAVMGLAITDDLKAGAFAYLSAVELPKSGDTSAGSNLHHEEHGVVWTVPVDGQLAQLRARAPMDPSLAVPSAPFAQTKEITFLGPVLSPLGLAANLFGMNDLHPTWRQMASARANQYRRLVGSRPAGPH